MDINKKPQANKVIHLMNRKKFFEIIGIGTGATLTSFRGDDHRSGHNSADHSETTPGLAEAGAYKNEIAVDLVIAGGGVGGCAAALSALKNNLSVVMTEETDWIGGQLTQQGVPPDEHPWIETHGATALYRKFRTRVRSYYKQHYLLTDTAAQREFFNPGNAVVSELSHEPRVALAVLYEMLAPYISNGKLTLLLNHKISSA